MSVPSNLAASTPDEIAAYVAALLRLLGDQDPVAVLRQTPAAIEQLLAGVPEKKMKTPEAPGKWSVTEMVAHLAFDQFAALRRANVKIWESLGPEDLARVSVHSERGEESLEHMRRLYAGHDILHLRQLERIRAAV